MAGEKCDGCGFVWDDFDRSRLPGEMNRVCAEIADEVVAQSARWGVRPEPERWSNQEYACHLRDVLLSVRERIILASVLDKPTGTALYRDDRVRIGLYAGESVSDVSADVRAAGGLFARTVTALPDDFENRLMTYSAQSPMEVTVMWVAAQGLHEAVHHLGDIRENGRLLAGN